MPVQPSRLKVAQQVVSMLLGGMLVMAVVAVLFTRTSPTTPTEPAPGPDQAQLLPRTDLTVPLAVVAVVLAIVAVAAPFWLARTAAGKARKGAAQAGGGESGDEAVLVRYKAYSVERVLGAVVLGIFCASAAILSGELWFLAGAAVAAAAIGVMFPTRRDQAAFVGRVTGGPAPLET